MINKIVFRFFSRYFFVILAIIAQSCVTEVGNPEQKPLPGPSKVRLAVKGTPPPATGARLGAKRAGAEVTLPILDASGTQTSGYLLLTRAQIGLSEIKLDGGDSAEAEYPGPYICDLLTNATQPEFPTVNVATGSYSGFKLKLDKIEEGDVKEHGIVLAPDDAMLDHSILLSGTYTGETASGAMTNIPFSMDFKMDQEFRLGGDNSPAINLTGGLNNLIIAFRLADWLDFTDTATNEHGYDFGSITPVNGAIHLTHDASDGIVEELAEVVKENIKGSADYGKDEDDSGELENDEDDDDTNDDIDEEQGE